MKYDFKRALTYMFKDKFFIFKLLFLFLLVILYFIIIAFRNPEFAEGVLTTASTQFVFASPISIPFYNVMDICQFLFHPLLNIKKILIILAAFPFIGFIFAYIILNAHNRLINSEAKLPEIKKFFLYMKKGISLIFGTFIITFPIMLILILLRENSYSFVKYILGGNNDLGWFIQYLTQMFLICLYLLALFPASIVISAALISYIQDLKLSSFVNLKAIKFICIDNFKIFFKYIFVTTLINIIFIVVLTGFIIESQLLVVFIDENFAVNSEDYVDMIASIFAFIIIFYNYFVVSDILAQTAKQIKDKKENCSE